MDNWVSHAMSVLKAENRRASDTNLVKLGLPIAEESGVSLYLKDESTHVTGSLKHRLARSLFLYFICNGDIREGTPIVEASSGSTAVSEAYFAQLLNLPFTAVIPVGTSLEKTRQIAAYGGQFHEVAPGQIYSEAERIAAELSGHYMDQFTNAERATDWRGNNNIAERIFEQLKEEPHPIPQWVVMSAGTGGTSTTLGRYIRYKGYPTRLCVPDPEGSVFFQSYMQRNHSIVSDRGSGIEGIGRPRVEPSFSPNLIDRMYEISDPASVAAMLFLSDTFSISCGPSTGTNLLASLLLVEELIRSNTPGSVVTIIGDSADRYRDTYYSSEWRKANKLDVGTHYEALTSFCTTGSLEIEARSHSSTSNR